MRAVRRVQALGLSNCRFYQGNMDYFKGRFDIGKSIFHFKISPLDGVRLKVSQCCVFTWHSL